MYDATRTFWLEPTDDVAIGLRRYHTTPGSHFDCDTGYHSHLTYTGRVPARYRDTGTHRHLAPLPEVPHYDRRWPRQCASCPFPFTDEDPYQEWQELIYRRVADGAEFVLHSAPAHELGIPTAPPGSMWDAWWMPSAWKREDGMYLMVRLPNGRDWAVDSQASNCTRPGEVHACWVRHGDPRTSLVTVDKAGDTCAAGAGSILSGDYHGFLHGGMLTAG